MAGLAGEKVAVSLQLRKLMRMIAICIPLI
jgi:hypothetical protein